jgi:ribosomal protein S18 acetylase RimI-like enzyme
VTLHQAALRSHLPVVLRETFLALLDEPALLLRLPGAAGLVWERRRERLPEVSVQFAEMVAFGVLPQYRSMRFIRRTGLRVPDLLLDYALDDVRRQGFAWGRGVVLVSNRPAVRFFTARAARVEPYPSAVRPSIQVWFDLSQGSTDSSL